MSAFDLAQAYLNNPKAVMDADTAAAIEELKRRVEYQRRLGRKVRLSKFLLSIMGLDR